MKIISKFKDYYDFVAGHDTDPRKVYVREHIEFYNSDKSTPKLVAVHQKGNLNLFDFFVGEVWFCDVRYPYFQDVKADVLYWDYDEIPEKTRSLHDKINTGHLRTDLPDHFDVKPVSRRHKKYRWIYTPYRTKKEKDLNTRFKAPVIFSYLREKLFTTTVINGRLQDVGFGGVLSASEAFTSLYNWIPYIEPDMPSDPTDMSRFENKGFSKKTSFRGK